MRYFDYSFLERGMLPAGLVNVVGAIAEFEAVIASMVKSGAIDKIGTARNTKYMKRQ